MSGKRFVFAAFSGMWVIFHIFTSLVVNFEDNRLRFFERIDVLNFLLVGVLPVVVGWSAFCIWERARASRS
jgi:hypothetical protein